MQLQFATIAFSTSGAFLSHRIQMLKNAIEYTMGIKNYSQKYNTILFSVIRIESIDSRKSFRML